MRATSKLCDAADWFRPEVQEIIENELREVPRFHRKQWESAMIFLSLRESGKLTQDKLGLSMGGGKELIAYAIAPHVKQLVITDLYETNTNWDCAKTDDPDEFIKQNKPFPVDDEKLKALRMDMRELKFPDKTFDFCYSTCAVEHIGGSEDFLRHFNEVARVLKDDGVYVFTTEVLCGNESIHDDHNYVFSLPLLRDLFAESNLVADEVFDARISPHKINYPVPSTLKQLSSFVPESMVERVLQEAPHIHLLRGKLPFTCGIFVMRKKKATKENHEMKFVGLEETKSFTDSGVREYREMLENSRVSINPFSLLPSENSRFFADHTEFFAQRSHEGDVETAFHTDYFWFGAGKRIFDVALRVGSGERIGNPALELRVHRYRTLASKDVECVASITIPVPRAGWMVRTLELDMDDEYCYAILTKVRNGSCTFDRVEVKSYPPRLSLLNQKENAASEPVNLKPELIAV